MIHSARPTVSLVGNAAFTFARFDWLTENMCENNDPTGSDCGLAEWIKRERASEIIKFLWLSPPPKPTNNEPYRLFPTHNRKNGFSLSQVTHFGKKGWRCEKEKFFDSPPPLGGKGHSLRNSCRMLWLPGCPLPDSQQLLDPPQLRAKLSGQLRSHQALTTVTVCCSLTGFLTKPVTVSKYVSKERTSHE